MTPPVDLSDIRALLVSHLDNAGIARVKMLPSHKIAGASAKGTTVSLSAGMLFSVDDHVNSTEALDATVGDLRGIPDMEAVAMLDAESGLAWAPTDLYALDGTPHPTCQRSALRRTAARAASMGYELSVGFEMEFTLFRGTKTAPELAHAGPGYSTRVALELEAWHLDTLDALTAAGVPVEQLHPEYGDGQLELSLAPRDPVRAVDDFLLARIVITRTALAHGLLVSFAPVPVVGIVSNGCHIHLSARRDGRNVFAAPDSPNGFSDEAGWMIAGILERLDEGVALHGGSVLSFERLKPHNWAGAYVCWGPGNREAALRFMAGYAGYEDQQSNIEVKCPDPAANHYLSATALIATALDGVERRLPLPPAVLVEPGLLDDADRAAARVRPFPTYLGAALDLLEASEYFRNLFGDLAFGAYLATRRHEWEAYGSTDPSALAALLRWRY
jgi:glutamine synthetase